MEVEVEVESKVLLDLAPNVAKLLSDELAAKMHFVVFCGTYIGHSLDHVGNCKL